MSPTRFDPKTVVRLGYGRSFDIGVFGSNFGHIVTQNLPVLANQQIQDSNLNPAATNNLSPVFTLAQGAPAFNFAQVTSSISSAGTLPLLGLDGTSGSRIRPTIQRFPLLMRGTPQFSAKSLRICPSKWPTSGTRARTRSTPMARLTIQCPCSRQWHQPHNLPDGGHLRSERFRTLRIASRSSAVLPKRRAVFHLPGLYVHGCRGIGAPDTACCAVDLTYFGNDASSNYEALQIKVERRFSHGLQFLAHYTYGHSNAYNSNYYAVTPKLAYGPDQYNRRNVFVISTVYELPIGQGKAFMGGINRWENLLIGGWQVTNTLNYSSGLPWTASIGECGLIEDTGPCRPNLVNGQSFDVGPKESQRPVV